MISSYIFIYKNQYQRNIILIIIIRKTDKLKINMYTLVHKILNKYFFPIYVKNQLCFFVYFFSFTLGFYLVKYYYISIFSNIYQFFLAKKNIQSNDKIFMSVFPVLCLYFSQDEGSQTVSITLSCHICM